MPIFRYLLEEDSGKNTPFEQNRTCEKLPLYNFKEEKYYFKIMTYYFLLISMTVE